MKSITRNGHSIKETSVHSLGGSLNAIAIYAACKRQTGKHSNTTYVILTGDSHKQPA